MPDDTPVLSQPTDQFMVGATSQPNVAFQEEGNPADVPQPDLGGGAPPPPPIPQPPPQPPPREPGTSTIAQNPPKSKAEFFRSMLGDFLYSVGKGLSAQNRENPNAGAGAAMQALPERNVMRQQMDIQRQNAEATQALKEAQADQYTRVPVTVNGQTLMLPAVAAKQILAAQATGESRENVAGTKAQSAKDVANINAQKGPAAQKVLSEAKEAFDKGDMEGYKAKLKEAGELSAATQKPSAPTEMSLLMAAQKGDKDASAALGKLQANRLEIAKQRGPASRPMNFFDPEQGRLVTMSAGQAQDLQSQGKNLVPAGQVPADKILQVQRAQRAVPAAIAEVRKNLKAWDNPSDKAIFSKILKENPMGGDTGSWFGKILDQALTEKLSTEGKGATIALRRLNDSLGSVRVISGLPSTVGSMMTTAALAPGNATPDSDFAGKQLDSLAQLLEQETGVPLLGGSEGKATPKATGKLSEVEARDYFQKAGGDPNKARAMAKKDGRTF